MLKLKLIKENNNKACIIRSTKKNDNIEKNKVYRFCDIDFTILNKAKHIR